MTGERDTIFAPATARGAAAVAVLRVSGPLSDETLSALVRHPPPARRAGVRWVVGADGEPVDECLVLRFEAGASFTGESAFELQCHGGPAVTAALLDLLASRPGLRLAEPGEFTRRALESGRLDLPRAEALADLVAAETEVQRRQAAKAFRGSLGEDAGRWREMLIRACALIEASLDFADEEIPEDVGPEVDALLEAVASDIAKALAGSGAAERVRDGFEVALIGAPNSGKSSLLNVLSKREVAITSEFAGTTRDVIEVHMDLCGLPVTLLDTAGLRETEDRIEALGIERARKRLEAADLRVFLRAPEDGPADGDLLRPGDVIVSSKSDLGCGEGLPVSSVTGEGLAELLNAIAGRISERASGATSVTRVRHRVALERGLADLGMAREELARGEGRLELAADGLRRAVLSLEALLGRVDAEDVLDDIFASFCLGK